jgi:hypothetical protein
MPPLQGQGTGKTFVLKRGSMTLLASWERAGGEVNRTVLTLNLVEENFFIIHLNKIKITR